MLAALSRFKIYKTLDWEMKGVLLEMLCALDRSNGAFFADKKLEIPLTDFQISKLLGVLETQWIDFKEALIKGGILKERNGGVYCPLLTENVEVKADPNLLALAEWLLEFWNSKEIQKHSRTTSLMDKIIRYLKKYSYTKEQLQDAILNYAVVLASDNYFWTKKWGLVDFLSRGVDRFVSDAKPLEKFAQRYETKKQPSILRPRLKEYDLDAL